MSKVALITGGASGMGLETAKSLAATGDWQIHILDLNPEAGASALQLLPLATFHRVDVTCYASLASAFEAVFKAGGHRIHFVFANAGIVERHSFYDAHHTQGTSPPREPNLLTLDINLNAVISTTYLAQHYFRISTHRSQRGASLVVTASCGGLYPSQFTPVYSASKAGVVHFMRSIAFPCRRDHGIRVYAICPGTVRTNLLAPDEWSTFPAELFTPVDKIASTVHALADGGDLEDSTGRRLPADDAYGLAVEINGQNHYFRDALPFCDDNMRQVMVATSMENQAAAFEEVKRREAVAGKSTTANSQHVYASA